MMQLFEPSQQLAAALILGACTLCAAIVNAVAQLRVARDARRKSQPAPRSPGVRRWVVLGAALALALGWSATSAYDVAQASDISAASSLGGGVTALIGGRRAPVVVTDSLVVASLLLRSPTADDQVVDLLDRYDMRAFALAIRTQQAEQHWLRVPVAVSPDSALRWARLEAIRRATEEACAYESVLAAAREGQREGGADTLGLRLVGTRAERARAHVQQLEEGAPIVVQARVISRSDAVRDAARDGRVRSADVGRFEPDWSAAEPIAAAPRPCGTPSAAAPT